MDLRARKEYAAVVKERYWKARSKKEKSLILDEYCANTGQARKYAIRKLRSREKPDSRPGERGRQSMMARLRLLWPRYGRYLTTRVASASNPHREPDR